MKEGRWREGGERERGMGADRKLRRQAGRPKPVIHGFGQTDRPETETDIETAWERGREEG